MNYAEWHHCSACGYEKFVYDLCPNCDQVREIDELFEEDQ